MKKTSRKSTRCTKHDWTAYLPSTAVCAVCGKRTKWDTLNKLARAREQAQIIRLVRES